MRFGGTLDTTGTNYSFSGESARRERANDVNHELQDIGCVEWNCWNSVQQLPFYIPAMERRGEEVPKLVRSANVTELVRVKPTIVETFHKCSLFAVSSEITIRYDTFTKDGLKNARDEYILELRSWWKPPSESAGGVFESFKQFPRTDFFQKRTPSVKLVSDVADCTV